MDDDEGGVLCVLVAEGCELGFDDAGSMMLEVGVDGALIGFKA